MHTAELHSVGCRGAQCSGVGHMVHSARCTVRGAEAQGAEVGYAVHGTRCTAHSIKLNSADVHGAQVWGAAVQGV